VGGKGREIGRADGKKRDRKGKEEKADIVPFNTHNG